VRWTEAMEEKVQIGLEIMRRLEAEERTPAGEPREIDEELKDMTITKVGKLMAAGDGEVRLKVTDSNGKEATLSFSEEAAAAATSHLNTAMLIQGLRAKYGRCLPNDIAEALPGMIHEALSRIREAQSPGASPDDAGEPAAERPTRERIIDDIVRRRANELQSPSSPAA
jgi:hypothetical protein